MTQEVKQGDPLPNREQLKGKNLEYLYQCSDPTIAMYPLLGSAIRALGKGWHVRILASSPHAALFEGLKRLLQESDMMHIEVSAGGSRRKGQQDVTASAQYELTLVDGTRKTPSAKSVRDRILGKTHVMVAGTDTATEDYDLISDYQIQELHSSGVTAITGTGKGKSTTAFGIAAAHAVKREKVAVVQWFKEQKKEKGTWAINEHFFSDTLKSPDDFSFHPTGIGFFGSPTLDRVKGEQAFQEHRTNALRGVELAKQMIRSGQYKVIVLDELVDTLAQVSNNIPRSLLEVDEVRELLELSQNHPQTRVVVTGRRVTPEWEDMIHQSIVISEVRHPWSSKQRAGISGLDF